MVDRSGAIHQPEGAALQPIHTAVEVRAVSPSSVAPEPAVAEYQACHLMAKHAAQDAIEDIDAPGRPPPSKRRRLSVQTDGAHPAVWLVTRLHR